MRQLRIIKTCGILFLLVSFSFSLLGVHGKNYTWNKGDKFTWETHYETTQFYENENGTWDEYWWGLSHLLDVKIMDYYPETKILLVKESWAYPGMTSPFIIQEVTDSCDLVGDLNNTDITNLFQFNYEFDPFQNDTYLSGIYPNSGSDRVPHHRFCLADWRITNELFQETFNDSCTIVSINNTDITFRDFLKNCSYTIMGTNNYTKALALMTSTNHQWSATFNYPSLLEIRDPAVSAYEVEEAIVNFALAYTDGGVLENYSLNSSIIAYINNNYTFHYFETHESHLTSFQRGILWQTVLKVILPVSLIAAIAIIVLVRVIRKKYQT
ncbi:MAG: hypothetical protein U9O98_07540 [Asgard group archaeon]|nr:hypothetical protein [Asgard group archaeon]